ncbi:MAG: DDE-type integrase/transposase/recombinase [Segetibacter sp.]
MYFETTIYSLNQNAAEQKPPAAIIILTGTKTLLKTQCPARANEVWVADITYLWLKPQDKFCYLSIITDLYSRKIVGHCVHESLSVKGCIEALKQAIKKQKK